MTVIENLIVWALIVVGLSSVVLTLVVQFRLMLKHQQAWAHPFHPFAMRRMREWLHSPQHQQLGDSFLSTAVWTIRAASLMVLAMFLVVLASFWVTY